MKDTRERILDTALEVLGKDPDAGMGEIAAVAGVVRRTVYGHFPSRTDLVRTLAQRAVDEVAGVLTEVDLAAGDADAVWAGFIARLWPVMDRYRVLVVLRRGEYSAEIHALLGPVERTLAELVRRGQEDGAFGRHLPADVLGRIAWNAVFAVADDELPDEVPAVRAATVTSLLVLGVGEARAQRLVSGRMTDA